MSMIIFYCFKFLIFDGDILYIISFLSRIRVSWETVILSENPYTIYCTWSIKVHNTVTSAIAFVFLRAETNRAGLSR